MTSSTSLGLAEAVARRDALPNRDIAPFVPWLAPQLENDGFDGAVVDRWLGKRGLESNHADLVVRRRRLVGGTFHYG